MVDADSQLNLLPVSTFDIYIKCSSTLICCPWAMAVASNSSTTLLGSYFGVLVHLRSQNDGGGKGIGSGGGGCGQGCSQGDRGQQ
jgi:hypothetical protein